MTQGLPPTARIFIRPVQYRDLDAVEQLYAAGLESDEPISSIDPDRSGKFAPLRFRYGIFRLLGLILNPLQYMFCATLPEQNDQVQGVIRVSPFNRTRSTWRVDRVAIKQPASEASGDASSATDSSTPARLLPVGDIGSRLLRHCLEKVWEARTWLLEVNVNDKDTLALYRQNGFQPLAHMTYWEIAAELLQELTDREPDLPNLLPVSNADAQLLYQLDTAAMPPLVRQVFDRHILDFKTSLVGALLDGMKHWLNHTEVVSGYVFESQRKAAIGYFQIRLCRNGSEPHQAQLTVHPAYTWLYPELICQMARITQDFPAQSLQLASSDYQPEREEYLERLGATRTAHTLMMSRSVWHKLRETKPVSLEGLPLSEVLQGFQPARKPVPGRISLLRIKAVPPQNKVEGSTHSPRSEKGPSQEGPCC